MTPAELITRKLKARLESSGVTLPVVSLLLQALDGEKQAAESSFIALSVSLSEQIAESLPLYVFNAEIALVAAIDDDKGGETFKTNHEAIWAAFDFLARENNCVELGDENDELEEGAAHVFAVDGFHIQSETAPTFNDDENGGTWTTSFAATITGRA